MFFIYESVYGSFYVSFQWILIGGIEGLSQWG
jgi:hypothetical protein